MARLTTSALIVRCTLLAVVAVAFTPLAADAQADQETPWPRTAHAGATILSISQPQVDAWDGFALAARFAVKATTESHTTYGVVTVDARTLTNKIARTVVIDRANAVSARFTGVSKDVSAHWGAVVASELAAPSRMIALDRLETSLAASDAVVPVSSQPLDTTPPTIIFVSTPTILVDVDGTPKYQPIPDTPFERLINTRALIVRDESHVLYLKVFDGWLSASSLQGRWTRVGEPSNELAIALTKARTLGGIDELTGAPPGKPGPPLERVVPAIHVASSPTELIVTDGPGNWTPVHGVNVFYLLNTTGRVLKSGQDFKIYALVAGRWFRTSNIFGDWSYVSPNALPSDFAKIPDTSPIENVKASIPGTRQAREAAIAATIAETERIAPTRAHLSMPNFDGPPTFKAIEGTSVEYAVNTATPLVRVSGRVFALGDGVWFTAPSVNGPWLVAASVPEEVYAIPPTSPLYYVTFVRTLATAGDTVFVGRFPGYRGTFIQPVSQVAVFGTGYRYQPWVDHEWFGAPVTYGFGSNLTFTPWSGWVVAFGLGWAWGDAVLADGRGWGVYPWWKADSGPEPWVVASERPLGLSYNSRTGIASAGQRGALENLRAGSGIVQAREVAVTPSGTIVPARPGAFFRMRPGDRVEHVGGGTRTEVVETVPAHRAVKRQSADGTVAPIDDDVFAGRDGIVYRRREHGWEAHGSEGWQAARTTDAMLDQANAMRDTADWRLGMARESTARGRP